MTLTVTLTLWFNVIVEHSLDSDILMDEDEVLDLVLEESDVHDMANALSA